MSMALTVSAGGSRKLLVGGMLWLILPSALARSIRSQISASWTACALHRHLLLSDRLLICVQTSNVPAALYAATPSFVLPLACAFTVGQLGNGYHHLLSQTSARRRPPRRRRWTPRRRRTPPSRAPSVRCASRTRATWRPLPARRAHTTSLRSCVARHRPRRAPHLLVAAGMFITSPAARREHQVVPCPVWRQVPGEPRTCRLSSERSESRDRTRVCKAPSRAHRIAVHVLDDVQALSAAKYHPCCRMQPAAGMRTEEDRRLQ